MTTEARKAQNRVASANNRAKKQLEGWKRLWIPPSLIEEVKELIRLVKK